MFAPAQSS